MKPRPHQGPGAILSVAAILAFLGILVVAPARALDAPVSEEIRNDTDPTKPVLFSLRDEYYNLRNERWQNVVILRTEVRWRPRTAWVIGP
jgi:hypothetical protein